MKYFVPQRILIRFFHLNALMHTEYDTDEVQRVVKATKLPTYPKCIRLKGTALIGGKKKSFTIL